MRDRKNDGQMETECQTLQYKENETGVSEQVPARFLRLRHKNVPLTQDIFTDFEISVYCNCKQLRKPSRQKRK